MGRTLAKETARSAVVPVLVLKFRASSKTESTVLASLRR
jgi:hypothetical protein